MPALASAVLTCGLRGPDWALTVVSDDVVSSRPRAAGWSTDRISSRSAQLPRLARLPGGS
jgi:hypothetical protein